jgi:hypothetical protein
MALGEDEAVLLQESCLYQSHAASFLITSFRVLVEIDGVFERSVGLLDVDKQKRSKQNPEPNDESQAKLRIIYDGDTSFDVVFTGAECENTVSRILKATKRAQKDFQPTENPIPVPEPEAPPPVDDADLPEIGRPDAQLDARFCLIAHSEILADVFQELTTPDNPPVSNQDFWEIFRLELAGQETDRSFQTSGYSTQMLSDVAADSSSKATPLRYTMTKDARRQIFRKKPEIGNLYRRWVYEHNSRDYPDGISPEDDAEFWRSYFIAVGTANSRSARNAPEQTIFSGVKLDDTVRFEAKLRFVRYRSLEPCVMVGPMFEEPPGCGNFSLDDLRSNVWNTDLEAFNVHSEIALIETGVISDTTRPHAEIWSKQFGEADGMSDLVEIDVAKGRELRIRDASVDQLAVREKAGQLEQAAGQFAVQIEDYAARFAQVGPPPPATEEDASLVLADMTLSDEYDGGTGACADEMLSYAVARLRRHALMQQTLLCQFWRLSQNTKENDRAKLNAVTEGLNSLHELISNEWQDIGDPELLKRVAPVYTDLDRALLAVIQPKPAGRVDEDMGFHFFFD